MRRVLAVLLLISLLTSWIPGYSEQSYTEYVSFILDGLYNNDEKLSKAQEQVTNGALHAVEMLTVIARRLDPTSIYEELIASVVEAHNADCDNNLEESQQIANSLYHCIELLLIIGRELDVSGKMMQYIDQVQADLQNRDTEADILEQQKNIAYRMVDILTIVANEKGVNQSEISSILESFQAHNTSDVTKKIINGLYRSIELFYAIGKQSALSEEQKAYFDEVYSIWLDVDSQCKGANQQAANGMYRIVEMLAGWAREL